MDVTGGTRRLEEMRNAAMAVCEGAKTLTDMLLEKGREEMALLDFIEGAIKRRAIPHLQLPHLSTKGKIWGALGDLLDEINLLRRGILPSRS